MAEEVATWRELYNVDGIDLDIEAGAGDRKVRNQGILTFLTHLYCTTYFMSCFENRSGIDRLSSSIDMSL